MCLQVWVWRHCGGEDFHTAGKEEGAGAERAVRKRKHFNQTLLGRSQNYFRCLRREAINPTAPSNSQLKQRTVYGMHIVTLCYYPPTSGIHLQPCIFIFIFCYGNINFKLLNLIFMFHVSFIFLFYLGYFNKFWWRQYVVVFMWFIKLSFSWSHIVLNSMSFNSDVFVDWQWTLGKQC